MTKGMRIQLKRLEERGGLGGAAAANSLYL
jgi:hypothetical protein